MISRFPASLPDEPTEPVGSVADQVTALVHDHITARDFDSADLVARGIERLALNVGHHLSIRVVNLDASPPTAEVWISKGVRDEVVFCAELQLVLGPAIQVVPYVGPLAHTRGGRSA